MVIDLYNPNVKVREPYEELVSELIVQERGYALERKKIESLVKEKILLIPDTALST